MSIARWWLFIGALALAATAEAELMCAAPGKQGDKSLQGVINTYWQAPEFQLLEAGQTVISLGEPRGDLNAAKLEKDDLLLVIQMQAADIDASNDRRYGDGKQGAGSLKIQAGTYELVKVLQATSSSVTIAGAGEQGGLLHHYDWTLPVSGRDQGQRRWQVIKVPQYQSATLVGRLEALPWDGSTGGVLAFDVQRKLNLNAQTLSVKGLGFRGGAALPLRGAMGSDDDFRYEAPTAMQVDTHFGHHGSKGEGIAGTPRWIINAGRRFNAIKSLGRATSDGYPYGSMAKGAPANAGGGGQTLSLDNRNFSAGGGGAGSVAGEQGTDKQGNRVGGLGGRPSSDARLTLGGGGGAAAAGGIPDTDGSGGAGGGIIFIQAGQIVGAGTFDLSGKSGNSGLAGGGGGGGGQMLLNGFNLEASLKLILDGGLGGTGKFGQGGAGGAGGLWVNGALLGQLDKQQTMPSLTEVFGISPGYVCSPGGITLSGLVFNDNSPHDSRLAYDGRKQESEAALANVGYALRQNGKVLAWGKTDRAGRFSLRLPAIDRDASTLELAVTIPEGWRQVLVSQSDKVGVIAKENGRWQLSASTGDAFYDVQLALVKSPALIEPVQRLVQANSTQIFLYRYESTVWGDIQFNQQVWLDDKPYKDVELLLDPDCSGRSMYAFKNGSQWVRVKPDEAYCVRAKVKLDASAKGRQLKRSLQVTTRIAEADRVVGQEIQRSEQVDWVE